MQGKRSLFIVSQVVEEAYTLWPSSTAFSDHEEGAGSEVELPGLKLAPISDVSSIVIGGLMYHAIALFSVF